jgi:hypothetical protein
MLFAVSFLSLNRPGQVGRKSLHIKTKIAYHIKKGNAKKKPRFQRKFTTHGSVFP